MLDLPASHVLWVMFMLACKGVILSLQAFGVVASANLVPGLLTAANKSRKPELAALLLMVLPANTANLTSEGGKQENLVALPPGMQ